MSGRLLALFALATLVGGCGADEPSGASAAWPDAGFDADVDAPTGDAGPPIRSITLRNPFGSADPHNLLVDGDFELSSSNGQFGWRAIGAAGEATLSRETGGLCRSGVTCGVLTPDVDLIALAVGPGDADIDVRLWAKPPTKDCTLTVVSLIKCTNPIVVNVADVLPTNDEADGSGWCDYHAVAPASAERPCLLVSSYEEPETRTLVDAASLTGAKPEAPHSIRYGAPRAELAARAGRAVRVLHESTRFGRPLPAKP